MRRTIIALPVCVLLLSGCLSYKDVTLKEVRSVQLVHFDDQGVSVRVQVVIDNPNSYRIRVKDPDVEVFLDNELLGKARFDSILVLDRKIERDYEVPVSTSFQTGLGGFWLGGLNALMTGEVRIRLRGTVKGQVGLISRTIPFELEQTVPIDQ